MKIEITKNNFDEQVLNSDVPVLVDFWATWCAPCRMLGPVLDEISNEYEGKINIAKINVDDEEELSAKFGIMSIPSVKLFIDGKVVDSFIGYKEKDEVKKFIDKNI